MNMTDRERENAGSNLWKNDMQTQIIRISVHSSDFDQSDEFLQCVHDLRSGKLVIFPTETVYGLGAVIDKDEALKNIYLAKGRPSDNPLIVHIGELEQLWQIIDHEPPQLFWKLAEKFWPGPVTFILKKAKSISRIITGNRDSVAVRFPSNKIAQSLINACSIPVAAPSANISGLPSPTRAEHLEEMMGRVQWIIQTEPLEFGLESTIISLLEETPILLRPGPITVEKLREFVPDLRIEQDMSNAIAPGMKYRHYSPKADIKMIPWNNDKIKMVETGIGMFQQLSNNYLPHKLRLIGTDETADLYTKAGLNCVSLGSSKDLYRIASNLFHFLRSLDNHGVDCALIEGFEEKGLGIAIMNRLKKAILK